MEKNYTGTYGVLKKDRKIIYDEIIHPEDKTKIKGGLPASIFKCIKEQGEYVVIEILGSDEKKNIKIKKEVYQQIKNPLFSIGDEVRLFKYPYKKATIRDISWHEKDERIIYNLYVKGDKRKSNSRYYEDENKFEKIIK